MSLSEDFEDAVAELLTEFGIPAVLRKRKNSAYNTVTRQTEAVTITDHNVLISPPETVSLKLVDGTTIIATDITCLVSLPAEDVTAADWYLILDSVEYSVVYTKAFYSPNVANVLYYELTSGVR